MPTFHFTHKKDQYTYRSEEGVSLGHPLANSGITPKAWYSPNPDLKAIQGEGFLGDRRLGGNVNSEEITLQPHSHGTHTECYGHLSKKRVTLRDVFTGYMGLATLCTIDLPYGEPIEEEHLPNSSMPALLIRTNKRGFEGKDFSNTNPSFLSPKAMQKIVDMKVDHLMIDLPSVDPERDGGALEAHKIFWDIHEEESRRPSCTITEMIRIPQSVSDGIYFMNLQTLDWRTDAVPSNPIIYPVRKG